MHKARYSVPPLLPLILLFILACTAQPSEPASLHSPPESRLAPTPLEQSWEYKSRDAGRTGGISACSNVPPLCEEYWTSRAVFTGRVVNISPVARHFTRGPHTRDDSKAHQPVRVRFFVTKAYRGRLKSDVTVETSTGGPPWGYDFNKGQTYLVYAKTTSKEYTTLTVEGCSRTKLAADGEEDLKFIGGLPKPNPDILEVEGGLRAVSKPPPSYPREARDAGISGSVFVRVIIDETGKVISAQALCGPTELVAAAEKAISNWQFVPTRISGRPVKISTIVSSNFAP